MRQITDIKEMQNLALIILDGINQFCEEKGITYFLAYGTLLGAIRHKGFIPWDDDIDLWMKREDFNRFCELFPAWGKGHGLYLNSVRSVDNYNRVQAKVCLSNTTLKENDRVNPYEEGYFIDLFPLDGTPNNESKRKFHLTRLQFLKNIVTLSAYNGMGNAAITALAALFRRVDAHKVLEKYEHVAEKYSCDKSEFLKVLAPGKKKGRDILIKTDYFAESVRIPFETKFALAPTGYDAILRQIYGDYMQLPPENARKPHHDFTLFMKE